MGNHLSNRISNSKENRIALRDFFNKYRYDEKIDDYDFIDKVSDFRDYLTDDDKFNFVNARKKCILSYPEKYFNVVNTLNLTEEDFVEIINVKEMFMEGTQRIRYLELIEKYIYRRKITGKGIANLIKSSGKNGVFIPSTAIDGIIFSLYTKRHISWREVLSMTGYGRGFPMLWKYFWNTIVS